MSDPLDLLKEIDQHSMVVTTNHKTGKKKGVLYLWWRIKRPLLKFHYKIYKLFNSDTPWLCITAIEFFKKYLTRDMVGVEFGSGSSTYFYCSRSKHVVSIEHHKGWYDMVSVKLKEKNIDNVDYRFISSNEVKHDAEIPSFYSEQQISPNDYGYRQEYSNYFNALSEYDSNTFDYILIDGRARPECLFTSLPKLKSRGIMILDNSERERYTIVFEKLKDWKSYTCTSGLTDTTFWIKP